MTLIETKTLGTAQLAIEFTSIPQTYTDLYFVLSLRSTHSALYDRLTLYFNGVKTGTSYQSRTLDGNGSAASSTSRTSQATASLESAIQGTSSTSNTFTSTTLYIPNYTSATNKSFSSDSVTENNGAGAGQSIVAGLWSNTAAITSVGFSYFDIYNLSIGSTISLYGITKGSDGIVTTS
jgi:hypothetical protein